jgi:signal transduction histidine kinase
VQLVQLQARKKSFIIQKEFSPDIPVTFTTDPLRISQIIINLLSNAIKFTLEGSITLQLTKKDRYLNCSVNDTGIGISKEDQGKLFKCFGRVEDKRSRKANSNGVGLGLFISNALAIRLGNQEVVGSLWNLKSIKVQIQIYDRR